MSNDELLEIQIGNARLERKIKELDIKLKEFELRHKPGFWKGVFASPAFLAALIAVCATSGTAFVSWLVAAHQQEADKQRNELLVNLEKKKYQASLLSGVVLAAKPAEPCVTLDQLLAYREIQAFSGEFREESERMWDFYYNQCAKLNKSR
jgi:hypothetical protein